MDKRLQAFERLLDIMDDLRAKCPWDMKQTMESLRPLTIEETYELGDAILQKDLQGVKEELGDLMLHMVFYAKIGQEKEAFDISDVLNGVCEKLIARHPHIYGDLEVKDEEEVKKNWEQLKLKEGKKSVLQGVPNGLPALIKALRIQDKAKQVGFEWETTEQVYAKVEEELAELNEEVKNGTQQRIEKEYGDLLFALVNYARFLNVDPELALERCNQKFKKRFQYIEEQAKANKLELQNMSLEEMDALWNKAKSLEVEP